MSHALVRIRTTGRRMDLDGFARAAGLHPELVRRLVALGLLEPTRDPSGGWWFTASDLATVARIQRLRAGLCVNYAGLGVVMQLLDRIAELESALRRPRHTRGGPQ